MAELEVEYNSVFNTSFLKLQYYSSLHNGIIYMYLPLPCEVIIHNPLICVDSTARAVESNLSHSTSKIARYRTLSKERLLCVSWTILYNRITDYFVSVSGVYACVPLSTFYLISKSLLLLRQRLVHVN